MTAETDCPLCSRAAESPCDLRKVAGFMVRSRDDRAYLDMPFVAAADAIGKLRMIEMNARALRLQIEADWCPPFRLDDATADAEAGQ